MQRPLRASKAAIGTLCAGSAAAVTALNKHVETPISSLCDGVVTHLDENLNTWSERDLEKVVFEVGEWVRKKSRLWPRPSMADHS